MGSMNHCRQQHVPNGDKSLEPSAAAVSAGLMEGVLAKLLHGQHHDNLYGPESLYNQTGPVTVTF